MLIHHSEPMSASAFGIADPNGLTGNGDGSVIGLVKTH